ncbi:MAG: cytochrome P450 [Myxococcota bacterium]
MAHARHPSEFDPFDPVVVENPWDFFAALRREAPAYCLPNGVYTVISRYADVRRAALSPDLFSSKLVALLTQDRAGGDSPSVFEVPTGSAGAIDVLAIADAPDHTRQRKLSNKAFSMRRVASIEPHLRSLAEKLVDAFLPQGKADWVKEMAVPMPVTIIAELIGLPLADAPRIKRWSDASVALLSGISTPEQLRANFLEASALLKYLAMQFDSACHAPRDDVLGDLIRASQDPDEALSRNEVISILVQLLTAGNETTTSLIGSALMLMLRQPDLEARLRADTSLIEPFIEEAIRLESPFYGHFRVVRRDTEVAGVPLAEGTRLMLSWASANRDENEFERPEEVDLKRHNLRAHLSFGIGYHHCIGAALARLETRLALETLLARTRSLGLARANDFSHVPSLFVRSLNALHIEFD